MQVYFPSVSPLCYLLISSIHCACPTSHARSPFHRPLAHRLPPPWHQHVHFSAPSFKSFPNTLVQRSRRLFTIMKKLLPWYALGDTEGALDSQPAVMWVGSIAPPPHAMKVPIRLCPWSTYAAHEEKALHGLYHSQAFWSPSCHQELPTSLRAASATSTELCCQKQQTGNGLLRQSDRRRWLWSFFKGQIKKNLKFCENWLAGQGCPYDHIWLPSVARFHQAG